jgi:hypothetical protein
MANFIYDKFGQKVGNKEIDLDTDDLKVCLLTSTYTPSNAHEFYAQLTNEVASGNGYTTGGNLLTGVTWTESSGITTLSANDPAWTLATFTARYAVIYDDTASGKPLICLYDFLSDKNVNYGTFTLYFNVNGVMRFRSESGA